MTLSESPTKIHLVQLINFLGNAWYFLKIHLNWVNIFWPFVNCFYSWVLNFVHSVFNILACASGYATFIGGFLTIHTDWRAEVISPKGGFDKMQSSASRYTHQSHVHLHYYNVPVILKTAHCLFPIHQGDWFTFRLNWAGCLAVIGLNLLALLSDTRRKALGVVCKT